MVSAPFQITVGTTPVRVVASHVKRTALGMANMHSTGIVYYSTRPDVAADNGFPIFPKTVRDLNIGLGDEPMLEYFAISDTAGVILSVTEQFLEKGEKEKLEE